METSSEFGVETNNQSVNEVEQFLNQWNQWKALNKLGLCERYLKAKLNILVYLRFAGKEYIAVFERLPSSRSEFKTRDSSGFKLEIGKHGIGNASLSVSGPNESEERSVMFISDVECVQPEKFICPSLVRLGSADCIFGTRPHSMYLSSKGSFVYRGSLENREASGVGDRLAGTTHFKQVASQVVEGTSEIVDGITSDAAERVGNGFDISQVHKIISTLRINLEISSVGCAVDEPIPRNFQIVEVLVGPIDFGSYARKAFIGSHKGLNVFLPSNESAHIKREFVTCFVT